MKGKFSSIEVAALKIDLSGAELDSFQAAQVIRLFVAEKGYGISHDRALDAARNFDAMGRDVELFRKDLEASALVM
jgi:hypothetical protein